MESERTLYQAIAELQQRLQQEATSFFLPPELKEHLEDLAQHCMDVRIHIEVARERQKDINAL